MNVQDIKERKVTVIGGARSGLAAAKLLAGAGADVFLTDSSEPKPGAREALESAGIAHEFGGHTARAVEADWFVISPGVPTSAPLVQQALGQGKAVYSEVEVASWFCQAPIVAITGSNGKTTTTSLAGHLFRTAGWKTTVAGNIGTAFADVVTAVSPDSVVVLEVSSFQLDHIDTFRPRVSISLNITPDHMDRYDHDFSKYAASKARIFENQGKGDAVVYNEDDAEVRDRVLASARPGARLVGFSQERELEEGAFLRGDAIVIRLEGQEEVLMTTGELALRGRHNLYNSMAAALAGRIMLVSAADVRKSLSTFEGVPHRLEFIREIDGVRYINDSKATNVDAVWYALQSFSEPIVLIAGGRDKGNDYGPLKPLVRERVRALVALGESAEKVLRDLGPEVDQKVEAQSMDEAIQQARRLARPGDVVLLSPACASFDLFQNYEHRGDEFRRAVTSLN